MSSLTGADHYFRGKNLAKVKGLVKTMPQLVKKAKNNTSLRLFGDMG